MPLVAMSADFASYNFNTGMPADVKCYDLDGAAPSSAAQQKGFTSGDAWIVVSENGNSMACSSSSFQISGTADDWMVMPAVRICDDAILEWTARATNPNACDGYSVYVSDKGDKPTDFTKDDIVFTTKAESSSWKRHVIDLAPYAGKDVWVAFVNESTNREFLYISNVLIGTMPEFTLDITTPNLVEAGTHPLTLCMRSHSKSAIRGFKVGFSYQGKTFSEEFPDAVLHPGQLVTITPHKGIPVSAGSATEYTMWVETATSRQEATKTIGCFLHKVVMEEYTGMACRFCVRGIVYIDRMLKKYPNNFIPIAVHNYGNDVLGCDYPIYQWNGAPSCYIDRNSLIDPSNCESYIRADLNKLDPAGITMSTSYDSGKRTLSVDANTYFYKHQRGKYRLAFVVIENGCYDASYYQMNAYAGSGSNMDGWENKPEKVTGMTFDHVARCAYGDLGGAIGSVPDQQAAMIANPWHCEIEIPGKVKNVENCEIVALLIDSQGHVVNADKMAMIGGETVWEEPQTVDVKEPLVFDWTAVKALNDDSNQNVTVYNLQGMRLLNSAAPAALSTIPAGIYIINGKTTAIQ